MNWVLQGVLRSESKCLSQDSTFSLIEFSQKSTTVVWTTLMGARWGDWWWSVDWKWVGSVWEQLYGESTVMGIWWFVKQSSIRLLCLKKSTLRNKHGVHGTRSIRNSCNPPVSTLKQQKSFLNTRSACLIKTVSANSESRYPLQLYQ